VRGGALVVAALAFGSARAVEEPSDPVAAEKQYRLAQRLGADRSRDAAAAFEKVVALAPDGPLADDALVELACLSGSPDWPEDVAVLDLRKGSAFTDYFVLASGTSQRQIVAIADAVQEAMRAEDLRPKHVEGYPRQEWILLDYSGFVVHIFTPRTRSFYDLERLWGGATRLEVAG